jgi:hypothetical protein
MIRTQYFFFVI